MLKLEKRQKLALVKGSVIDAAPNLNIKILSFLKCMCIYSILVIYTLKKYIEKLR